MWFTIGFAAACALAVYLGIGIWVGLVTVLAAAYLLLLKKPVANIIAVILIGVTAGAFWTTAYHHFYLDIARNYDGKTVQATAVVSDFSYETDYGVAADAETSLDGKSFRLRLYYPKKTPLKPGDRIEGAFRFRMTTDDSEQGGTYHQGNGIFLLAYVDEEAKIAYSDKREESILARISEKILRSFLALLFLQIPLPLQPHCYWATVAFWIMKPIQILSLAVYVT